MVYGRRSIQYYIIYKFTDIDNIEHITINTINALNINYDMKYNVGDIVTIKYIKNSLIHDEKLKSRIFDCSFNLEQFNLIKSEVLEDTTRSMHTYNNYFSESDKDITLTDNSTTYSTIFKTQRTKVSIANILLIISLLIFSAIFLLIGYLALQIK